MSFALGTSWFLATSRIAESQTLRSRRDGTGAPTHRDTTKIAQRLSAGEEVADGGFSPGRDGRKERAFLPSLRGWVRKANRPSISDGVSFIGTRDTGRAGERPRHVCNRQLPRSSRCGKIAGLICLPKYSKRVGGLGVTFYSQRLSKSPTQPLSGTSARGSDATKSASLCRK